jgi:hypothetical protein
MLLRNVELLPDYTASDPTVTAMRNSDPKLPIKTGFTDLPRVVGVYIDTQMGPHLTPILIFGIIIWHIVFSVFIILIEGGGRCLVLPPPHPIPAGMIAYTVPLLNRVPCVLVEPVWVLTQVKVLK